MLTAHASRRTALVAAVVMTVAMVMGLFATGNAGAQTAFDNAARVEANSFVEAGVSVSRQVFETSATGAVLATTANFPDALASSALASQVGGPVLFTDRDSLPPATADELDRILTAGASVQVMGGPAAISDAVVADLRDRGYAVDRVAGPTRLETAAEAALRIGAPAGRVLLARAFGGTAGSAEDRNTGWVDSVSCGGHAADTITPILLTETNTLSPATADALTTLGATSVTICGGPGAVSEEVEAELNNRGLAVRRVRGTNRVETAVEVAKQLFGAADAAGRSFILVNGYGDNYGYGLAATPLSAAADAPILLVNTNEPTDCGQETGSQATLCYLQTAGDNAATVIVVGAEAVVSAAVFEASAEAAGGERTTTSPGATPSGTASPGATTSPRATATSTATATATATATGTPSPGATPLPTGSSAIDAPELQSVTVVGAGAPTTDGSTSVPTVRVRFSFDEAVRNIIRSDFLLYTTSSERVEAVRVAADASDAAAVFADFRESSFNDSTTAAVADGAVQDGEFNLSPEGALGLRSVPQSSGMTNAPDLIAVDDFKADPTPPATAGASTLVDFSFDEPAFTVTNGYRLVRTDGSVVNCARDDSGQAQTHVVTCPNGAAGNTDPTIDASQVARAFVLTDTVSDAQQDANMPGTEGNGNPQQAVPISGGTPLPDLLTVTLDTTKNEATFTFDDNIQVSQSPVTGENTLFRLYAQDGTEVTSDDARRTGNNVAVAEFDAGEVTKFVVGASVAEGAVSSTASGQPNRVDEFGIAQTFAAGETAGPELDSVARTSSGTGGDAVVTILYTFEIPVSVASSPTTNFAGDFVVYAQDGTRTEIPSGECAAQTGDNAVQVACTVEAADAQFEAAQEAVLGAVERDAVRDTSNTFPNYEASRTF
jgi:putative cell wall-binding protein